MLTIILVGLLAQNPTLPAEVCNQLHTQRSKFQAITSDAQLGEILNNTAWILRSDGWGLSGKKFGTKCPSQAGEIACDILHRKSDNMIWDVMIAAGVGFPSEIDCGEALGVQTDLNNRPFVAPVDPGITNPPPPPPPTPELERRIAALENSLVKLQFSLDELRNHLHEPHNHEPNLDVIRDVVNQLISTLKIDIGRAWGHSHNATIIK